MPVTLKKGHIFYKNNSGTYTGLDVITDKATQQQIDLIQNAKGYVFTQANQLIRDLKTQLPENLQSLLLNFAPIYDDNDHQYNVGDYCIFEGSMYHCIVNTIGTFNPNCWEALQIGEELQIIDNSTNTINNQIEYLKQSIKEINNLKSNKNEIMSFGIELDIHDHLLTEARSNISMMLVDLAEVQEKIKEKAGLNQLYALYTDTDMIRVSLKELQDYIKRMENKEVSMINELMAAQVSIDITNDRIDDLIKNTATINQMMSVFVEFQNVNAKIQTNMNSLSNQQSQINTINTSLINKISKPLINGNEGQVLSLDENNQPIWVNSFQPSDEQINQVVSDWLNDHPQATTTVADGSITEEKLSADILENIRENTGVMDNIILSNIQNITYQASSNINNQSKQHINLYNILKQKLFQYATFYNSDDGIGFIFFTDPHNANDWYGETPYEMIEGMRLIRTTFENSPAQYVVCGGDWLNYGHTYNETLLLTGRIKNLCRTEISDKCYNIIGNHDNNSAGTTTNNISQALLRRLWFDSDKGYYTVDTDRTTAFMFDSGLESTGQTSYRLAQAKWFAESLLSNTKPHLFGFIHILHSPEYIATNSSDWLGENLTLIANTFNNRNSITVGNQNYNFSSAIGTFHFMCCGHYHSDGIFTRNGIPILRTDTFHNAKAFDLCYANFNTAKLSTVRIGVGNNRTMNIISNIE